MSRRIYQVLCHQDHGIYYSVDGVSKKFMYGKELNLFYFFFASLVKWNFGRLVDKIMSIFIFNDRDNNIFIVLFNEIILIFEREANLLILVVNVLLVLKESNNFWREWTSFWWVEIHDNLWLWHGCFRTEISGNIFVHNRYKSATSKL